MKLSKEELNDLAEAEAEKGRFLDVDTTWRNMHPFLYKAKPIGRALFTILFWNVIMVAVSWKGWPFLDSALGWVIAIIVVLCVLGLLNYLGRGLFAKTSTRRKIFTILFFSMAAFSWLVPFQWSPGFSQLYYILTFIVLALAITGN